MSGNTSGKDKLKSIDKNQCVPRMKKLRGRIVRPAMSTAEIKASDARRKAEEEEEKRRKAEEEQQLRLKELDEDDDDEVNVNSQFLQAWCDDMKAYKKNQATATTNAEQRRKGEAEEQLRAKELDKDMQNESDDSDQIPVSGEAVPKGFGQKQWMEERGLPYGGDDRNSWTKKRAAAGGNNTVPEDGNNVSEAKQSAPTYTLSSLQVDENDWFDKTMAKGKELPKLEDGKEENPLTPRSPDYDLFDGDEKARDDFCKYAAKQKFDGRMGW